VSRTLTDVLPAAGCTRSHGKRFGFFSGGMRMCGIVASARTCPGRHRETLALHGSFGSACYENEYIVCVGGIGEGRLRVKNIGDVA
jgi:hypothetical protein